jgi:hypothetical protein
MPAILGGREIFVRLMKWPVRPENLIIILALIN